MNVTDNIQQMAVCADFEIPANAVKCDEKRVYRNTWLTIHTSHVYTTASNIKQDNFILIVLLL